LRLKDLPGSVTRVKKQKVLSLRLKDLLGSVTRVKNKKVEGVGVGPPGRS
jgi:hypothetical protein